MSVNKVLDDSARYVHAKEVFPVMEEMHAEGKQVAFSITGMSMWPFLCHRRDQVVLEKCKVEELNVGDIVCLQSDIGDYIVHRVTKIVDGSFETIGDGKTERDGVFFEQHLRAKVVKIKRKGKEIDCENRCWRLVCKLWMMLFPLRTIILPVFYRIAEIKNKK